jgi:tRNA uridine 5-carboxymethylaminomethyl modification enzyme
MNHSGMHSSSSSAKSSPQYDVIVVGGGHAGCEAALSCARMGARTLMLTMRLDTVAAMSCNPAIGGVAKGQVVREIDALGGEMGKAADATVLQFRMLNRSKGEAVWSPRAQCDRRLYHEYMRKTLERQDNLSLKAGEVCGFLISRDHAAGVVLSDGTTIGCRCVIVTTVNSLPSGFRKLCANWGFRFSGSRQELRPACTRIP